MASLSLSSSPTFLRTRSTISSSVRSLCGLPISKLSFRSPDRSLAALGVGKSDSPRRLQTSRAKAFSIAAMAAATAEKKVEVFNTEEDIAVSLAKYTADLSDKFCKERGSFTVVLSGGSLINSLRKLLEPPYKDSIDWSKWHVFWVDERVVPKNHEDSNYKLAFDLFLSRVPIPPGNVYAINDALSAEGAADDYEACLKRLVSSGVIAKSKASGFPKLDLQLLGMGPDGHIASLFPGHPLCKESTKWVTHILDSPKPPPQRITFTFPVINSSAYIALVVCESDKADAVHRALGSGGNNKEPLPCQLASAEGEFKWFLDKAAASKL
ncbi:unnamed protein product [Linum trigynum]|uniref:Probable 6-phosphogluconolactonase n=1 Tax=Linum trigynum TaxID=586398 RepID=A0AAV2D4I0_9ROSI